MNRNLNVALAAGGMVLAATLLQPSFARAHDIWVTAHRSGSAIAADVSFGDLIGPVLADPARIVSLELIGENSRKDLRRPLAEGSHARHPVWTTGEFQAPSDAVVAVAYDNGFWLTVPGDSKETNASKLMIPNGAGAHMTVKYGKLLLGPGAYAKTVGARLELSPLKDPFALAAGSSLPVRLVLNGRPLAGAEIAYTDGLSRLPDAAQPTVKTDQDGIASIPLTGRGPHLLTTNIEAPPIHPDLADKDHIYASLAFDTSDNPAR